MTFEKTELSLNLRVALAIPGADLSRRRGGSRDEDAAFDVVCLKDARALVVISGPFLKKLLYNHIIKKKIFLSFIFCFISNGRIPAKNVSLVSL